MGPPVLLSSHDSGSFVFCREAVMNDGTKYCAVGEANGVKDNLWSEYLQQYPAETADNRAYERAVLGIVGLYGKIYGGSEIPFSDEHRSVTVPEKAPEKQAKEQHAEQTVEKVDELQNAPAEAFVESLPKWWNDIGVGLYTDKQLDPDTFIVTQGQCKGKTGRSNICMTITIKAAGILPPEILKTHRAKTSPSRYMPAGAPSKKIWHQTGGKGCLSGLSYIARLNRQK